MSIWEDNHIEEKITQILQEIPDPAEGHHLGKPFLTAYQIAIEFARRFPEESQILDMPVGGAGTGQKTSLAQYLARELSRHIKNGAISHIEGGFLSDQHLKEISFLNGGEVVESSLTGSGFNLSIFRLTVGYDAMMKSPVNIRIPSLPARPIFRMNCKTRFASLPVLGWPARCVPNPSHKSWHIGTV